MQRSIDLYRKKLTDEWNENGVIKEIEYAILTNKIYKEYKNLRKEKDNMSDLEAVLADISENTTRELAK